MKSNKLKLIENILYSRKKLTVLVTAIKLPSGAIEVTTNYQDLENKLKYILENYDDQMRLKRNKEIQIIDYILI